jgi:competence protein CoiA
VRPRIALTCPECGFGVHARVSKLGLRHFAHDPGRPDECELSNESIEHHLLKLELATAIREAGWHAELEVRAPDGSWRADVMASTSDGQRRWAWEAQLSPITDDELRERTARYAAQDIEVCWVSPRDFVPWIDVVPAVCVAEPRSGEPWTVADGIAGFDEHRGSWLAVEDTPLGTFVGWALDGKLAPQLILRRYRRVRFSRNRQSRRNLIWTTEKSVAKHLRHEQMRQRQDARKADRLHREQEAETRRLAAEKAEREERERQRKIEAEAWRIEQAERTRQLTIKWEQERLAREERERAAEAERAEREERERASARDWWQEISRPQWEELLAAIAEYGIKRTAARAEPRSEQTEAQYAYGVAIYAGGKLYGIARPHPASLYRLESNVLIFVRSTYEAERILATGNAAAHRVVNFGFPDHEQLQLY